jgi:tRNA (guanine37-N1)-methyltransferase
MKITVITLFPKMIAGFFEESILKRAKEKQLVEWEIVNLREFATDSYGTVDDKPYGGGVGMVLKADIISKALEKSQNKRKVIYTSPKGVVFTQEKAKEYAQLDHLVILAGHYEGIDERIMDEIDEEVSIGDFVMTGGEIAAAAIADATVRLIPNVLKQGEATEIESFYQVDIDRVIDAVGTNTVLDSLKQKGIQTVRLLEFPQYTRPEEFNGKRVPDVLLSGNHAEIERWRLQKAFEETLHKRPDLLADVV